MAIKVAHSERLSAQDSGSDSRKLFFNEAHTAGRLTHPNIVGIYDAGVDGDNCYIVMEYVQGGKTLTSFCKPQNLLPVERVIEIIFKCAEALDYAHRQGVIHRDVKPSNILITDEHDVKIGDFGIAFLNKMDASRTMPLGVAGSVS